MRELFQQVCAMWSAYWSGGFYPWLLLLAAVYLVVGKRREKPAKILLAFAALFLIVFFCPVSAAVLQKCIGGEVYWRVLWLLPTVPFLAYAFTEAVRDLSKGGKAVRVLAVALFLGAVALGGKSVWQAGNYEKVHNYQKVPDDVAQICEFINSERGASPVLVAADDHVSAYLRVYDPSVRTIYGRGGKNYISYDARRFYRLIHREKPKYAKAGRIAGELGCDYIVLAYQGEAQEKSLRKQGYRLVKNVEEYGIFKAIEK